MARSVGQFPDGSALHLLPARCKGRANQYQTFSHSYIIQLLKVTWRLASKPGCCSDGTHPRDRNFSLATSSTFKDLGTGMQKQAGKEFRDHQLRVVRKIVFPFTQFCC